MTDVRESNVHQVFEKIYKNYDKMNSIISFQQHKYWRMNTMKNMNVKNGSSALDICCGTGDWTITLARAIGEKGNVVGLDFSKNMLSIAKAKIEKENYKHVRLLHGNAMSLPFADQQFDYVTIGFGLRNVPDYLQVLCEMFRVLKPGGKAVSLETSNPSLFLYKQLYNFYFKSIMPKLGGIFAKSYDEYRYLQQSTLTFPDKDTLAKLFEQAGFINIKVKSYSGGVAAMHLGEKKEKWSADNGSTKNKHSIRDD